MVIRVKSYCVTTNRPQFTHQSVESSKHRVASPLILASCFSAWFLNKHESRPKRLSRIRPTLSTGGQLTLYFQFFPPSPPKPPPSALGSPVSHGTVVWKASVGTSATIDRVMQPTAAPRPSVLSYSAPALSTHQRRSMQATQVEYSWKAPDIFVIVRTERQNTSYCRGITYRDIH